MKTSMVSLPCLHQVVFSLCMSGLVGVLAGPAHAAPFVGGGVVVSVVGDGTTPITTGTVVVPITLTEYTTTGSLTGGGVTLPGVDAAANYATTASMSTTSFGFLKRSLDGNYLTMTGANVPAGTQVSAFSSGLYPNRTIARIDTAGNVDTSTRFNAAGTTPRSAITITGTDFWWSGDTGSGNTGGIRYMALGATTSGSALAQGSGASATTAGQPAPVPYNMRVLNIFNGQLYGTSGVAVGASGSNQASFRGVFNVGTGLPTTANQFGSLIAGSGTGNAGLQDSPYDFFFADASTLYIGDDDTTAPATGGITKWLLSGTTWTKTWLALPGGATGVRALAGVTDTGSGTVELYGVTGVASGQNQLIKLSDTLSGTTVPSFSVLATAPLNYLFRGVAMSPVAVPEPSTCASLLAGLACGGYSLFRRRKQA